MSGHFAAGPLWTGLARWRGVGGCNDASVDESDLGAEIDRLCAPGGSWLPLLDGAPAVGVVARRAGRADPAAARPVHAHPPCALRRGRRPRCSCPANPRTQGSSPVLRPLTGVARRRVAGCRCMSCWPTRRSGWRHVTIMDIGPADTLERGRPETGGPRHRRGELARREPLERLFGELHQRVVDRGGHHPAGGQLRQHRGGEEPSRRNLALVEPHVAVTDAVVERL